VSDPLRRAIVVFGPPPEGYGPQGGHGVRGWRRLLRPGFRHCFAAVEEGGYWILFDPQEGRPELRVLAGGDFDLAAFYRESGYDAVETAVREAAFVLPVMAATCVAAVKRIIGLRAPLVVTPWQLYRRLVAEHGVNGPPTTDRAFDAAKLEGNGAWDPCCNRRCRR
jgi:hypothetical protein